MKLLNKYRSYTYTSLVIVVVIAFSLNYYLFRFSIHRTTDDILNEYRLDIEEYAAVNGTLLGFHSIDSRLCNVKTDIKNTEDVDETIIDTLVYSRHEKEMVVFRKLSFPVVTEDTNYLVELILPTLEEDDLVETVFISQILFIVLFITLSSFIDRYFANKILRPFTRIIDVMRTYNIEKHSKIKLKDEGIDEFRELNMIFKKMVDKINHGYDDMRNFLEHTSHEMKTPLAIIELKLENLSQKNFTDEETINCISSIQKALNRIVRFNHSLLFIAKIKNNQFSEVKHMDMNRQISQFIELYNELIKERNIAIEYRQEGNFKISIHPILAEQLVNNVLTNAIKYNYNKGYIKIVVSERAIMISNTFERELPEGDLFEKYKHSTQTQESSGLGLAIVKNICDKNRLYIHYSSDNKIFNITIEKV